MGRPATSDYPGLDDVDLYTYDVDPYTHDAGARPIGRHRFAHAASQPCRFCARSTDNCMRAGKGSNHADSGRKKAPLAKSFRFLFVAALAVLSGCTTTSGQGTASDTGPTVPPASTASSSLSPPASQVPSTVPSPAGAGVAKVGSVPAGFSPVSFSAVSASQWWILGWAPCGSYSCPTVLETTDGGTSFVALPAPGGPYDGKAGTYPAVSQIRFANPQDGWVFDPDLYATHDGGEHWSEIRLSGSVLSLAAGLDSVFALVAPPYNPCSHTATCSPSTPHPELWRAVPSSNDWQPDVAAGCVSGGLAVHQRQVWVMNCADTPDGAAIGSGLLHSGNSGGTFSLEAQPTDSLPCQYRPVSDSVVWDYCSGGHFMFAGISTDGGAHFTATADSQASPTADGCPNGSSLIAASVERAVAACNLPGDPLLLTVNQGVTWTVVERAVNPSSEWKPIGFTTTQVGYAFLSGPSSSSAVPPACRPGTAGCADTVQLWRTLDGGSTWQQVPLVS